MKADLLFLSHNRAEFTATAAAQLFRNTNPTLINRVVVIDDASTDGADRHGLQLAEMFGKLLGPDRSQFIQGKFGGPVAIMNYFYALTKSELFAKIDSDTVVPTGWLDACMRVMEAHPAVELLGIEAGFTDSIEAWRPEEPRRACQASIHIGGIGLMRGRIFERHGMPRPNGDGGRFGFTKFQQSNDDIVRGWLKPALPVVLLDRMPYEPWKSLSERYLAAKIQRDWGPYELDNQELYGWLLQCEAENLNRLR